MHINEEFNRIDEALDAEQKIDKLPKGSTFDDAKKIDSVFKKSSHTWSEVIETFERNQKDAKPKIISVKDIAITQPNIQSNKVKTMFADFDKLPLINVVEFADGFAIYDGHHRLAAAWALDMSKIKVNLVKAN